MKKVLHDLKLTLPETDFALVRLFSLTAFSQRPILHRWFIKKSSLDLRQWMPENIFDISFDENVTPIIHRVVTDWRLIENRRKPIKVTGLSELKSQNTGIYPYDTRFPLDLIFTDYMNDGVDKGLLYRPKDYPYYLNALQDFGILLRDETWHPDHRTDEMRREVALTSLQTIREYIETNTSLYVIPHEAHIFPDKDPLVSMKFGEDLQQYLQYQDGRITKYIPKDAEGRIISFYNKERR